MEDDQKLWREYRDAWEAYSRKNAGLHCLMDSVQPEKSRIELVIVELERARIEHSAARDRLAKRLSATLPFPYAAPLESAEPRVRNTAQLLWEMAGRPEGTAEGDWLRAEDLIRSASKAAN